MGSIPILSGQELPSRKSARGRCPISAKPTTGRLTHLVAGSLRSSNSAAAGPKKTSPSSSQTPTCSSPHHGCVGRWHDEQSMQPAKRRRRRSGARYPGRRRRLRCGYRQGCKHPGLLVAGHHEGHNRGHRRWLRRVLDFLGRRRSELGSDGWQCSRAGSHRRDKRGMVVFAASGDNDSSDGGPGRANVDLPASAPHVIGCGGTHKPHSGEETVWNNDPRKTTGEGTGGGYSTLFPMPSWQAGAPHGPGRLVPDVAANADPNTGSRSFCTATRRSSAAPAPWRRSTPGYSRHSERSSASSRRNCT